MILSLSNFTNGSEIGFDPVAIIHLSNLTFSPPSILIVLLSINVALP